MSGDSQDGAVTVEQLLSGEPLPISAFRDSEPAKVNDVPAKLTTMQRIAVGTVAKRVVAARQNLQACMQEMAAVMRECGLDPDAEYKILADGTVEQR